MGSSYYKHTSTHTRKVPYSFQCEQCMAQSGPLIATLSGEGQIDTLKKTLDEKQTKKLKDNAHLCLRNYVYKDYKDATEKNIFTSEFKDTCPHCQKPQSWAISGMKSDILTLPIAGVIIGAFLFLVIYFFEGSRDLVMSLIIGGAVVVGTVGAAIYKAIKVAIKTKATASCVQKNLPTIEWSAVQDLIDEKLATAKK